MTRPTRNIAGATGSYRLGFSPFGMPALSAYCSMNSSRTSPMSLLARSQAARNRLRVGMGTNTWTAALALLSRLLVIEHIKHTKDRKSN